VGDTAYVGGTITDGTNAIGVEDGVIMIDNAPSATADQTTGLYGGAGSAQDFCNGAVSLPQNDLASGDIAITP
jgi:hypothetical protein